MIGRRLARRRARPPWPGPPAPLVAAALALGCPTPERACPAVAADDAWLPGVWAATEPEAIGDRVRFWYFHPGGHGLFRYGRLGLTATHGWSWTLEGDALALTHVRYGRSARTRLTRSHDAAGRPCFVMDDDPEQTGARYCKVRGPLGDPVLGAPPPTEPDQPGDRVWLDWRNHASGGGSFRIYQLGAPGVDGGGTGWFHEGDFHDWTTESLRYRVVGDRIELCFDLRGDCWTTPWLVAHDERGRVLHLLDDPRDYWSAHAYRDAGRTLGGFLALATDPALWPRAPARAEQAVRRPRRGRDAMLVAPTSRPATRRSGPAPGAAR